MKPCMISVDWDFFLWRPGEARISRITLDDGREIPCSFLAWDLQNEGLYAPIAEGQWLARHQACQSFGLEPARFFGVREDLGGVQPTTFLDALVDRFDFEDAPLFYGDSHARGFQCAYDAFEIAAEPIRVVHFDAHADLGYRSERVESEISRGIVTCESWLYHALKQGFVSEVDIVYPDWRSDEWSEIAALPHMAAIRDRVRVHRWSEWSEITRHQGRHEVVLSNVARSSTWTPPWFDDDFAEFIDSFPLSPQCDPECMDCDDLRGVGRDACTKREFQQTSAEESARQQRALAEFRAVHAVSVAFASFSTRRP